MSRYEELSEALELLDRPNWPNLPNQMDWPNRTDSLDRPDIIERMDRADRVCGNCAHWDYANLLVLPVRAAGGRREYHVAPCLQEAVEPDAGPDALALLGAASHCRQHADLFQPDPAWLDEHFTPPDVYNGVRPGLDHPWSLRKSRFPALPPA